MSHRTKPLPEVTDHELVLSLGSKVCPACGGNKHRKHTFCAEDYFALPRELRADTYSRLGHGYREAIFAALRFLKRGEQFIVPEDGGL